MMTTDEFFDELINENMILAVLSGCRRKDAPSRVRIRPVEVKGRSFIRRLCRRARRCSTGITGERSLWIS